MVKTNKQKQNSGLSWFSKGRKVLKQLFQSRTVHGLLTCAEQPGSSQILDAYTFHTQFFSTCLSHLAPPPWRQPLENPLTGWEITRCHSIHIWEHSRATSKERKVGAVPGCRQPVSRQPFSPGCLAPASFTFRRGESNLRKCWTPSVCSHRRPTEGSDKHRLQTLKQNERPVQIWNHLPRAKVEFTEQLFGVMEMAFRAPRQQFEKWYPSGRRDFTCLLECLI